MNRIKGSAIWQTNKNDVQTHKSQRFSGELGFNYEPDEHHSFGLRYMPETGIGNADRNSSGKTVTRRNDEETDRINFTTAEQIHTGWDHAANATTQENWANGILTSTPITCSNAHIPTRTP